VLLSDSATGSPQSITLTGTGLQLQAASLSSTSLTFAGQAVHTTGTSQSVTMTNTGDLALHITSIAVTGPNASSFVFGGTTTDPIAGSCGPTLAPGASCLIHGHFTPTSTGPLTAAVTITDNAGDSPQSITLTGTGNTSPAVTLTSTSLTFAAQTVGTTSASQSVTLTNTGGTALSISSILVTGPNASSFVFANSCGTQLAAGASCLIHGHFTPTSTGPLSAAVTITDSAGDSPQSISLSGTGQ
jgi:trimeric autotransporter adhesin